MPSCRLVDFFLGGLWRVYPIETKSVHGKSGRVLTDALFHSQFDIIVLVNSYLFIIIADFDLGFWLGWANGGYGWDKFSVCDFTVEGWTNSDHNFEIAIGVVGVEAPVFGHCEFFFLLRLGVLVVFIVVSLILINGRGVTFILLLVWRSVKFNLCKF